MKVLVLTEAGSGIGMGHLNRCIALSDGFKEFNIEVNFLVRGPLVSIPPKKKKHFQLQEWFDKSILTKELNNYNIVIIDSYQATNEILKYIGTNAKLPVYLIDSTLKYYPKGVVFFPSIYAKNYKALNSDDRFKLISGRDYLLYDSILWKLPKIKIKKNIVKIGISLGGDTYTKTLQQILDVIKKSFLNMEVTIFKSGHDFKEGGCIFKYIGFLTKDRYIKEVHDTDLMIVNGGQSLNECLFLGIPSISIILAKNQEANAKAWEELGLCKSINHDNISLESVLSSFLKYYKDEEIRKTNFDKSEMVMDTKGCIKAVEEILNYNKSKFKYYE
jgi:spore coat polysaccharide biosynthesis predicted glycosyltransferase SpsG